MFYVLSFFYDSASFKMILEDIDEKLIDMDRLKDDNT